MRKKTIKALFVTVSLLFGCNLSGFAQSSQKTPPQISSDTDQPSNGISDQDIEMLRLDLRAKRKQITAENLPLTSDEATKFWPVYEDYRKEAIKSGDKRWALLKEYAANYNNMTDAQAEDYMNQSTAIDQEFITLRMKYVPLFEKVISPKKTALWYQIDRHIDLLINLQLSSAIPMVDTSKQN
jgi:hypothetical protein